ncbi:MAG: nucleotidyltransferase family protein [Gemmatimonadota bacterium]|nr:MAG: nucleotidyltransferase family protein [Gemmatimonadota bacterium]
MITATILAAGTSSRMGFPKALLRFHNRTFLQTILDATEALGVHRLVVIGPAADNILCAHDLRHVKVSHNLDMDAGPIGSIRAAVQEVWNHPVDGLLVWPVDFPHVAVETARALIDGFKLGSSSIVVPQYRRRRGHPVIFGRAVFDELLAVPDSEGARGVVRANPERVLQISVDDPAVVDHLNTPDAYQDLLRREDRFRSSS